MAVRVLLLICGSFLSILRHGRHETLLESPDLYVFFINS